MACAVTCLVQYGSEYEYGSSSEYVDDRERALGLEQGSRNLFSTVRERWFKIGHNGRYVDQN